MSIKTILDKNFEYNEAINNRYNIPNKEITIQGKNIKIELLVTNGFVKLYTIRGRLYGIAQVAYANHWSPDWKFHFNVKHEDIHKAWDIIASTFIEHIKNYFDTIGDKKKITNDIFFYMKSINTILETSNTA